MDDRLLLGIDIGTSSSKGVLVDLAVRIVAEHAEAHGFDMPQPGWAGTYQAMILTLQTLAIPFSVWLLKSFMDEVPLDLEEAAWVDGATRLSAFFRIIIPLALPGIIVTSMFTFVFSWNNVLFPLILSKQSTTTLPVGTISFFASTGVYWNQIAATAVVAMLPPMLIFLILGRYVVRGLTFGAVKG